jgi:hypothetical protein
MIPYLALQPFVTIRQFGASANVAADDVTGSSPRKLDAHPTYSAKVYRTIAAARPRI